MEKWEKMILEKVSWELHSAQKYCYTMRFVSMRIFLYIRVFVFVSNVVDLLKWSLLCIEMKLIL